MSAGPQRSELVLARGCEGAGSEFSEDFETSMTGDSW